MTQEKILEIIGKMVMDTEYLRLPNFKRDYYLSIPSIWYIELNDAQMIPEVGLYVRGIRVEADFESRAPLLRKHRRHDDSIYAAPPGFTPFPPTNQGNHRTRRAARRSARSGQPIVQINTPYAPLPSTGGGGGGGGNAGTVGGTTGYMGTSSLAGSISELWSERMRDSMSIPGHPHVFDNNVIYNSNPEGVDLYRDAVAPIQETVNEVNVLTSSYVEDAANRLAQMVDRQIVDEVEHEIPPTLYGVGVDIGEAEIRRDLF